MNVTWQAVELFEDYPDSRALLKEFGTQLKQLDPYQHPRNGRRAPQRTTPLDDCWMTFASYGTPDDNLGAAEHQLYAVPFVNLEFAREDSGAGKSGLNDVEGHDLLPMPPLELD